MLLKEVIEEILEKAPNHLSPRSVVRKINQVRNRLIRDYGSAQVRGTVCTAIDLIEGKSQYVPPCPPNNIIDVDILESSFGGAERWRRIPHRQFNREVSSPYYYFLGGIIGIIPVPTQDVTKGLKIFHIPVLNDLTLADMDKPTGFDPDYDMLLVYGVLREITTSNQASEYDYRYQQLLNEYQTVSSGFESYITIEDW